MPEGTMTFADQRYLVETDWLDAHLGDGDLRILDCTVFRRDTDQVDEQGRLIRTTESGRAAWAKGHIPCAVFADLIEELSDTTSPLLFTMPPAEQFAEAMSRYGVGQGTQVVCYDAAGSQWAAGVWWMLRAFGFDHAAVLNGGWQKWTLEGRPVSTDPPSYPPGRFEPKPRPELIATKDEVLAAIQRGDTCLINALMPDLHRGEGPSPYGRPGHIPSSVNVPAGRIVDPATGAYLPLDQLRAAFESVGATGAERVIAYCGGGIAASSDALVLTLLGVDNVAVYDGSLSEWAADESLPMEVG